MSYTENMGRLFTVMILVSLVPLYASAHGNEISLEKTISGYTIDIGYQPQIIHAGDKIVFDFNLRDGKGDQATFTQVRVRLEGQGDTVFATSVVRAPYDSTSLLYRVPDSMSGSLKLFVRYEKGDNAIAETSFDLPVEKKLSNEWMLVVAAVLIGTLVGAGTMLGLIHLRTSARAS